MRKQKLVLLYVEAVKRRDNLIDQVVFAGMLDFPDEKIKAIMLHGCNASSRVRWLTNELIRLYEGDFTNMRIFK